VVRRRCLDRRLLRPTHPSEKTPMIAPGMTLVIRTKRVGPRTHMNLREAMILGLQPSPLAAFDSWRLWAILSKALHVSQGRK
jgi:hypothetical protein